MPIPCAGASPRGPTPGDATEPGVAAENPKSRNHPRGVAPMSMGSAFKCELTGPSASKAGKFVPLYVETFTGCRALGASGFLPPRLSDENSLARRHDAHDHERW